MNREELDTKKYELHLEFEKIEKEFEERYREIDRQYVEDNKKFQVGDVITDGKKIIRIESIEVRNTCYDSLRPDWSYVGELLTKKLTGKGKTGKIQYKHTWGSDEPLIPLTKIEMPGE